MEENKKGGYPFCCDGVLGGIEVTPEDEQNGSPAEMQRIMGDEGAVV